MSVKRNHGLILAVGLVMTGLLVTLLLLLVGENPTALVWLVVCYCAIIVLISLGIIAVINRWIGRGIAVVTAASFVAICSYSLYFVSLNLSVVSMLAALLFGLIFGLLLQATRRNFCGRLIGAIALAATPAISLIDVDRKTVSVDSSGQAALLDGYAGIHLSKRPNIYLIGFDALIPREAAKLLLDVKSPTYDEAARSMGATVQDNVFASETPSIASFDSLMVLDDNRNFDGVGYFTGRLESPVSVLFKANGYFVQTGSSIPFYFGSIGAAIDEHIHPTKNLLSDSSLCRFASAKVLKYAVFGLCGFAPFFGQSLLYDEDTDVYDPQSVYFDSQWHEMVLAQITAPSADQPKLAVYYYYFPIGHAPNDFDSADQRQLKQYKDRFQVQMVKAAEVLTELDAAIRRSDPKAIVFYFGDHGTKISRTVDRVTEKAFWVQDNHSVFFATTGIEATCTQHGRTLPYRADGYTTLGRNLAALIHCLAEEPEKLDQLVEFVDRYNFSEFLLPSWQSE